MVNNSYGFYNSINPNTNEQWIRISEGCPNQCEYSEIANARIAPVLAQKKLFEITDF